MTYAKGISEFVDRCNQAMPPNFYTLPLEQQRNLYLGLISEFPYEMSSEVSVIDDAVFYEGRSLPMRVYRPKQTKGQGVLIYIRGGGFVVGSLETHNTVVAELCHKSGLVTIAPDFRMSPEYPFPAALEDCYGVICGVVNNAQRLDIDPSKIVIAGDSSGANMAVVVSMISRDRGGPKLRGQALISPVLDFTRWCQGGVDAPLLTGGEMEYYTTCYVPKSEHAKHPYISPLVSGAFHDLPPAYIMAAEMDSLLVDSKEYTQLLRERGIQVELVIEPGLVHSAVRARALSPQVADAWKRFCHHATQFVYEEETNDN
jgi:acetyl esterase